MDDLERLAAAAEQAKQEKACERTRRDQDASMEDAEALPEEVPVGRQMASAWKRMPERQRALLTSCIAVVVLLAVYGLWKSGLLGSGSRDHGIRVEFRKASIVTVINAEKGKLTITRVLANGDDVMARFGGTGELSIGESAMFHGNPYKRVLFVEVETNRGIFRYDNPLE